MTTRLRRNRTAPAGRPFARRTGRAVRPSQPQQVVLPAPRPETEETYTWLVNAAVESGRTDLAYELAAGYPAA